LRWPLPALEQTFAAYLRGVEEIATRLAVVDDELRAYFTSEPFAEPVRRLRCFRGISDLAALTIAAELGDARRFPTAPRVMGFVGLVPSEHSSGSRRGRGAITKTGNAHLRRILLETAWHYRHHPYVGPKLRVRQRGAPSDVISRAWAAQHPVVSNLSATDGPRSATADRRHGRGPRTRGFHLGHAGVVI
jgi:transposase